MPVFGNQTGTGGEAAGGAVGSWAVMPEDGTITKISAYIQGHWQNQVNVVAFIALDNGSETGSTAPAAGCVSQVT